MTGAFLPAVSTMACAETRAIDALKTSLRCVDARRPKDVIEVVWGVFRALM